MRIEKSVSLNNKNMHAPNMALLGTTSNRFFAEPLEEKLLGMKMSADLYVNNGFRFIAVPANEEQAQIESEIQKFRNIYKLSRESAMKLCIKSGYDSYVQSEDINRCLSKLQEPRSRIVFEMFWPHLSGQLFNEIRKEQSIASLQVTQILEKSANHHNGNQSITITHALAIIFHSMAISHELTFAAGNTEWNSNYWEKALLNWAKVFEADSFWEYLRKRIEGFDDPRIKPDDVSDLRAQLPKVILALNALFAQTYAKAEQCAASSQHIKLITHSLFPASIKQEILSSLIQALTVARLDPLIQQVNSDLLGKSGRQNREEVEKIIRPILEEAMGVRNYLLQGLEFSPDLVELSEFDRLCELVVKGIDTKINYDTDDRVCSILYAILTVKKMLSLPLSTTLKRRLEQSNRNDIDTLYGDFQTNKSTGKVIDPSKCWFLEGEEASPEASFLIPMYKITSVKGPEVRWQKRQILVPRSDLAQKIHKGELTLKELANIRNDEKCNELMSEIDKIKAKKDESIGHLEKKRDHSIQQQKKIFEDKLNTYNARMASEEIKLKNHIKDIEQQLQKDITKEKCRSENECNKARRKKEIPIARAREEYRKVASKYNGWNGWTRLELPIFGIISFVLMASALIMTLTNSISARDKLFLIPILAVIIGLMVGFFVGKKIRTLKIARAHMPFSELEHLLNKELYQLQQVSKKNISELQRQAKVNTAIAQNSLLVIDAERGKIKANYDAQVKGIQLKAKADICDRENEAAKEIKPLEDKLKSYLEPKPESAKTLFPPYQAAKSMGYKDGKDPSRYEINQLVKSQFDSFMNSLTYSERNTIAMILQIMGESKAMEIINMLIALSPLERSRQIMGLNILDLLRRY
jgi:hypothetical protein